MHCVDLGESFPTHIQYFLAKFGFDTDENEPFQVCPLSAYRSPRFIGAGEGSTPSVLLSVAAIVSCCVLLSHTALASPLAGIRVLSSLIPRFS